jgi:DNA polymerase III gamma/tau subunit
MTPGAMWLTGPPGSGKSTLARLIAAATLCPNRKQGEYEPCGECDVCKGDNTDNITHYVVRDATEVKEVFQQLIDQAYSAPHSTTDRPDQLRRFIIVDELQNASKQSISMLLDPLEFGPPTTTWILVSMDPDKLDPIVRDAIESRCKEINLNKLSVSDIKDTMTKAYPDLDESGALAIARLSNGNMRRAWSVLEMYMTTKHMSDITEAVVLGDRAGGASRNKRKILWDLMKDQRNVSKVRDLVDSWTAKADPESVAQLLIEDILRDHIKDPVCLRLLASLSRWISDKHKAPLSTYFVLHVYDRQIRGEVPENVDLPKIEDFPTTVGVLATVDQPSPGLEDRVNAKISQLCSALSKMQLGNKRDGLELPMSFAELMEKYG